MNRSLQIIQVLAKIGKIMSKIIYICCIVGFCGCIVGILSIVIGAHAALKVGSVTLNSVLQAEAHINEATLYTITIVGMLLCAGEGVLARFAEHYFRREIADGTPFHMDGAKELFRLGILTICIPLGTLIAAEILQGVLAGILPNVETMDLKGFDSVELGVMFMVLSLFCRHGAELQQRIQPDQPN